MSYPKNYKKNCQIYDKFLYTDLKDHRIAEDSTNLTIFYNATPLAPSNATINASAIKSLINGIRPSLDEAELDDIWLPAIIKNDDFVYTKEALMGNAIGNKTLGIEEIIKFPSVELKNWRIDSGSVDLCLDWIINTNLSSYEVKYGVLFWYKLNTKHKKTTKYSFDKIPIGTRIRPTATITKASPQIQITTTDTIIKVDNNRIRLLNQDSSKFDSSSEQFVFKYTTEPEILYINDFTPNNVLFTVEDNNNSLSNDLVDYDLWISNGEFYSYFLGGKDEYDRFVFSSTKLPTRSYLSPSLYHIYRSIYNVLTLSRIKWFPELGYSVSLEKLQKLCYILATSPLIDKVNINYLQDQTIQNTIYDYIYEPSKTNIDDELEVLLDVIAKIFKRYKQQSYFLQKQTLAHNYVNNKKDLLSSLLNKYGAYLKISQNTELDYKNSSDLSMHNPVYINMFSKSCFDKNISATSDVRNDMKVQYCTTMIETQMDPDLSEDGSICKIKTFDLQTKTYKDNKNIPLSNMAIKRLPEKLLTIFNKDIKVKLENPAGEITKTDRIVDISQQGLEEELAENVSYSWSLIDGPDCLRFSDFTTNRQNDALRKNRTSADPDPNLYVQQTGLYTIQGITSFGSTLKSIENIRVYVHNDNNEYAPDTTVPALMDFAPTETVKKYRVMCPNIRQVAVNPLGGMVWFVDTDMFICDASYPAFPRNQRLVDQKIAFTQVLDSNSDNPPPRILKISFTPNNTIIKLFKIQMERMRTSTEGLAQCKSFYEPKLARQRDPVVNINVGAARFYRINKYPDTIDFYKHKKTGDLWTRSDSVAFPLPKVSTAYAPDIYTYGGYSQKVIEDIGLEIPFHPINVYNEDTKRSEIKSFNKIPSGTFWNVKVTGEVAPTSAESGLIASDPAKLTKLNQHNFIGGADPTFRCHLANVPVTGYIAFDKGYFHPNSGWYYSAVTGYNPQGSEAYKFLSDLTNKDPNISSIKKFDVPSYKSFQLYGEGFYDLRANNADNMNTYMEYSSAIKVISYKDYLNMGELPLSDQDPNYGIRNWNGVNYKNQELVDDFLIVKDKEVASDFICDFIPKNTYALYASDSHVNSLKIQDLELKINFMNFSNTKNIIFALEVHNPELDSILGSEDNKNILKDKVFVLADNLDRSQEPVKDWVADLKTKNSSPQNLAWLKFTDAWKKTNTTTKENTRILYLYNQESLDNYEYNFSVTFSDNASNFSTFTDENKYSVSGVGIFNSPINNNYIIRPCISPTGYSEKESLFFRQIVKQNKVNLLDCSFAKFKNLPLRNTTFTLKVYIGGPDETIKNADNTLLVSQLSGLSSFYQKTSSNTIANSICNWEIIIHTQDTTKFTNKDYIGYIDYEADKVSRSGYNFIANLTNKEYLIPKINLNAPYQYIKTNNCKYINNEDISKSLTYNSITFPYVGSYIPGFSTLVGALMDIQILQIRNGIGGRGDPIINMLFDIRFQRQQIEQERYYFKPVYDGAYLGSPDKALIQASKDKIHWYRMEAPIIKYQNATTLSKNTYNYIRLYKDTAIPLSNFPFILLKDIEELIDSNDITFTTIKDESLSGLTVSKSNQDNDNITLKEYDIVLVKKQNKNTENGLYYALSAKWIRYPDPGIDKTLFKHKLLTNDSMVDTSNIKDKKIILVPGSRAYNLFDKDDSICVMKKPAAKVNGVDMFMRSVVHKALFNLSYGPVSVFSLSEALPAGIEDGYIGKDRDNSNSILIYKNYTTYNNDSNVRVSGTNNRDVGKWGLLKTNTDKKHIDDNITTQHSVIASEGSIGYGTNLLEPDYLSIIDQSYPNKIIDTTDIFNNHINDKLKYNNINISYKKEDEEKIKTITFNSSDDKKQIIQAYPYRYKEAVANIDALYNYDIRYSSGIAVNSDNELIYNSGSELSVEQLKNLKLNLKNNLQHNESDYYFIDVKSNKFITELSENESDFGTLIIENDYIKKIPMSPISASGLKKVKDRLQTLNTKSQTPPTINLETISSIPDLENFYNNLRADPTGCLKFGTYTDADRTVNCSGQIAKQKLFSLYAEKNDLLTLLEQNKSATSGVLPYWDTEIVENSSTNAISIKRIPQQYYIINIDPNQQCSLSEDVSIKVFKQATYECQPVVEFFQYPECDSVCRYAEVQQGKDENLNDVANVGKLVYKNNQIVRDKQKYSNVTEWDDNSLIIEKNFFMSCEDNPREVLVKVKEEYIVPKQPSNKRGLVKDILNLSTESKVFIKFRNIPRKIKTIDKLYNRYIYDFYGRLGKDIIPPPGGSMDNNFFSWQCIKTKHKNNDIYADKQLGELVEPPDFFKWMNEMTFRGFFGSVDGIEHKNTNIIDSKEMWEWIPYEYFSSGNPPPNE